MTKQLNSPHNQSVIKTRHQWTNKPQLTSIFMKKLKLRFRKGD